MLLTDCLVTGYTAKVIDLTIIPCAGAVRLAVGAGGLIAQTIELDENDPPIWDTANSKMLNVQIVNSNDFYSITKKPPPPTPIDLQTYHLHGVPYSTDFTKTTSSGNVDVDVAPGSSRTYEIGFQNQLPGTRIMMTLVDDTVPHFKS